MVKLVFCIKNSLLPTSSFGGGVGCIDSSSFGGGWEEAKPHADRDVYEKLRQNPDLLFEQPIAVNFKNYMDNTTDADLYDIKAASELQLSGTDVLKQLLIDNQNAISNLWQQLALNDSLYTLPDADISLLDIQRTLLKEQLSQLLASKESLITLLTDERNTVAEQIKQQNNIIAANAETRLSNEKIINSIYLATAARSNFDFSSEQIQQINDIANQCPITGGRAVFAARSLYEAIEPTIYNDDAICQAVGISQKTTTNQTIVATEKYFSLMPNPSTGTITLVCNNTTDQETQAEIYNALGQQLAVVVLPAYQTSITTNLSYLSTGVYFVQLKQNNTLLQTEKLTLIH